MLVGTVPSCVPVHTYLGTLPSVGCIKLVEAAVSV